MTTLIHVQNSEGTVGRCDAKCYGAESAECSCICGGMNHGKGLTVALEQTRDLSERNIRAIEARGGYVSNDVKQLTFI